MTNDAATRQVRPLTSPVAGIDRWRGGWIIVNGASPASLSLIAVPLVVDAISATEGCSTIAVDMPMALPRTDRREAEVLLRARLGASGRSVFTSPTRAAIEAESQRQATDINRRHGGPGISAQAWGLAASIRELRAVLPTTDVHDRWFETHPESAFAAMNGGAPLASKRSALGVGQRLSLLGEWCAPMQLLEASPARVPVDDVLDAVAAWWSARRIATGSSDVIGPAGRDDEGHEQSIRI